MSRNKILDVMINEIEIDLTNLYRELKQKPTERLRILEAIQYAKDKITEAEGFKNEP